MIVSLHHGNPKSTHRLFDSALFYFNIRAKLIVDRLWPPNPVIARPEAVALVGDGNISKFPTHLPFSRAWSGRYLRASSWRSSCCVEQIGNRSRVFARVFSEVEMTDNSCRMLYRKRRKPACSNCSPAPKITFLATEFQCNDWCSAHKIWHP